MTDLTTFETNAEIEEFLDAIVNPKQTRLTIDMVIIENEFVLAKRLEISQAIADLRG